jgi:hypothetical protein
VKQPLAVTHPDPLTTLLAVAAHVPEADEELEIEGDPV